MLFDLLGTVVFGVVSLGGWLLAAHRQEKLRDYQTDLSQNIVNGNISRSDLRRTREYSELEYYLEKYD